MMMNRPGPHQRDLDRFTRSVEKFAAQVDAVIGGEIECDGFVEWNRASTGTCYCTVTFGIVGEVDGKEVDNYRTVIYRFASHPECYSTHDFSVWSGGGCRNDVLLPPGYDGRTADAIAHFKRWAGRIVDEVKSKQKEIEK